jgi:Fe-S-cluster-containing dehydrogenase component
MPSRLEQMMKCDMCYDRTSVGKKPMCATVCPSGALAFTLRSTIKSERREVPVNEFIFGRQTVRTKVHMLVPAGTSTISLDVLDHLWVSHKGVPQ